MVYVLDSSMDQEHSLNTTVGSLLILTLKVEMDTSGYQGLLSLCFSFACNFFCGLLFSFKNVFIYFSIISHIHCILIISTPIFLPKTTSPNSSRNSSARSRASWDPSLSVPELRLSWSCVDLVQMTTTAVSSWVRWACLVQVIFHSTPLYPPAFTCFLLFLPQAMRVGLVLGCCKCPI